MKYQSVAEMELVKRCEIPFEGADLDVEFTGVHVSLTQHNDFILIENEKIDELIEVLKMAKKHIEGDWEK